MNVSRRRRAVIRGSSCRTAPAAALRGFAKGGLPSAALGVQTLEAALRHVDLAAHLECLRELFWDGDRQGDTGDRLHVRRDVFTDVAVAASGTDLVAALIVEQAHGQPIDL